MAAKKLIYARRGDIIRPFTEQQWKLLGSNKVGWKEISDTEYQTLLEQSAKKKQPTPELPVAIPPLMQAPAVVVAQEVKIAEPKTVVAVDLNAKNEGAKRHEALLAAGMSEKDLAKINLDKLEEDEYLELLEQAKVNQEAGEKVSKKTVAEPEVTVTSSEFTVAGAKEKIQSFTAAEQVVKFIKGEKRAGIKTFAADFVKSLSAKK